MRNYLNRAVLPFSRLLLWSAALVLLTSALSAQTPPRVVAFAVDDGSIQRSLVRTVTIQFSADVSASLTASDLTVLFLDQGSVIPSVMSYNAGTNRATWSFPSGPGGSLPDGTYDLTLAASSVFDAAGRFLDGNGDGVSGDDFKVRIHRFFGDWDGDRDVDFLDTANLQKAIAISASTRARTPGEQALIHAFDYDDDNDVDTADIAFFERNYLSVLPLRIAPVFRAIADVSPTSGPVPLVVRFRSRAEFPGGSIVRYRWDFQGDGVFDTSDSVATDYTRTFSQPGTFNAVLEVTNNLGNTARDTVAITVTGAPPTVTANASPSNGAAPLLVTFSAVATDTDGTITNYEWDFEGDGVFDASSPSLSTVTHTYAAPGRFTAVVRVTDNSGLMATARTTTTAIEAGPPGSPSIQATANGNPLRIFGNAPLSVSFSATVASGGPITLWEWDFNGDGVYDFSSATTPNASFVYTQPGIFAVKVRATNSAGLKTVDTVEVDARISPTLVIPADTFDPTLGQTVVITTTLNATVPVRLLIKDKGGSIVRTLVAATRSSGTYSDLWDGRNNAGNILPQGAYFAVLEYVVAGETRTVDLTQTTGGTRYNPSRSSLPSSFRPFEDNLLAITFTIPPNPGASEVQAFIGLFNTDTRFITLVDRVPFGAGTHTLFWDGRDPSGKAAVPPPGDAFLFGIWGFSLPDNAIFIQSAPQISNLTVDPNYFDPSTSSFLTPASPTATLTFDLSKTANLALTVTNLTTGKVLRTIVQPNVAAGVGKQIQWDGHADDGLFADKADYRLTLQAIDSTGSSSLLRYALVRVFY